MRARGPNGHSDDDENLASGNLKGFGWLQMKEVCILHALNEENIFGHENEFEPRFLWQRYAL